MKDPERPPKKPRALGAGIGNLGRVFDAKELAQGGRKLYRDAKGLRAAAKTLRLIDLTGTEALASVEETYHDTLGSGFPEFGRAVKKLDAAFEGFRFSRLQGKPEKLKERRKAAEDAQQDLDTLVEGHDARNAKWVQEANKKVAYINELAKEVFPGPQELVATNWATLQDLQDDLANNLEFLMDYADGLAEPDEDDDAEQAKFKSTLRGQFRNLIGSVRDLGVSAGRFSRERATERKQADKAMRTAERRAHNPRLPEERVMKREALLDDAERMLASLHASQLARLRLKRKMEETALDIRELSGGREPDAARERLYHEGVEEVLRLLQTFTERGKHFASVEALREHIKDKHRATELERRPIVLELEEAIEGTPLPAELREAIWNRVGLDVLGPASLAMTTGDGRWSQLARTELRYAPLPMTTVQKIEEMLTRTPQEEPDETL